MGREAVGRQLRWMSEKRGVATPPTAYGLRHTFATDFLLTGKSIKVLTDLMGTSVAMIERHYGHVQVDRARVRSLYAVSYAGGFGPKKRYPVCGFDGFG